MDKIISVFQTALPVFIALGLGIFCRSKQFIDRNGIETLKKVVINLTLPFVLLNAFATADYSVNTIAIPVLMFFVCCIALGLGFIIARIFKVKIRLSPFLAAGCEAGMLGYALFVLLFPDRNISSFAILDIGQTLFVFTVFKILISGNTNIKQILKDMAQTPILWATAFGVIIGATGLYSKMQAVQISGIMDSLTNFLSAPTGMIILLVIGYDLSIKDIPWKQTMGMIAMRFFTMVVSYLLIVIVNRTLLDSMIFEGAALLMFILPPPYVIPVFSDDPNERNLVAVSLSSMTLCTIILFAILAVMHGVT